MKFCNMMKKLSVLFSISAFFASVALADVAGPPPTNGARNDYERKAIAVVHDFTAAFLTKDVQKTASYMEQEVEFRVDPSNPAIMKGQELLQKMMKVMMSNLLDIKTEYIYAVGDSKEVLVIERRIDGFDVEGKRISVAVGGFYRVNPESGKIKEWMETPLVPVNFAPPKQN